MCSRITYKYNPWGCNCVAFVDGEKIYPAPFKGKKDDLVGVCSCSTVLYGLIFFYQGTVPHKANQATTLSQNGTGEHKVTIPKTWKMPEIL